jgi:hypothetical protein
MSKFFLTLKLCVLFTGAGWVHRLLRGAAISTAIVQEMIPVPFFCSHYHMH